MADCEIDSIGLLKQWHNPLLMSFRTWTTESLTKKFGKIFKHFSKIPKPYKINNIIVLM